MAESLILSIKKALDIIDILVFEDFEGRGKSLTELSRLLEQRTNTMHNILKTMTACGYVSKNDAGLYTAGRKCRYIGDLNGISPGSNAYKCVKNTMAELSAKIGEPLVFTIFSNGMRIPVLRTTAKSAVTIDVDLFEHENIFSCATGRVLAAFAGEPVAGLPFQVWDGIKTAAELSRRLEDIRRNGFCKAITAEGQVVAMAVPVKIHPLGALGCYAPVFRCDDGRAAEIIALLQEGAKLCENNAASFKSSCRI